MFDLRKTVTILYFEVTYKSLSVNSFDQTNLMRVYLDSTDRAMITIIFTI